MTCQVIAVDFKSAKRSVKNKSTGTSAEIIVFSGVRMERLHPRNLPPHRVMNLLASSVIFAEDTDH